MKEILHTLAFFEVLNFAPDVQEIHDFLYRGSISFSAIEPFLKNHPDVINNGKYFAFENREELLSLRETKNQESEKLWIKVKRWHFLFRLMPFIKGVAVCNNLAMNNVTEKSDIDLFIITKKNRMFLARFIMTAILHLLRLRRHGQKIAGRFCLSFWISEDGMDFEKLQIDKEDIYLAFWMKSLKPITGYEIFKKFMQINCKWLVGYFGGHQGSPHELAFPSTSSGSDSPPLLLFARRRNPRDPRLAYQPGKQEIKFEQKNLLDFIDNFIGKYQLKRIGKRKKLLPNNIGIKADCGILKFHDNDRRYEFKEEFLKRIKEL